MTMTDETEWRLKVEERLTRLEEQHKRLSELMTETQTMVKHHKHERRETPSFEYG